MRAFAGSFWNVPEFLPEFLLESLSCAGVWPKRGWMHIVARFALVCSALLCPFFYRVPNLCLSCSAACTAQERERHTLSRHIDFCQQPFDLETPHRLRRGESTYSTVKLARRPDKLRAALSQTEVGTKLFQLLSYERSYKKRSRKFPEHVWLAFRGPQRVAQNSRQISRKIPSQKGKKN